jgi:glutathione-specific gamma-glutamylcyclotransferase
VTLPSTRTPASPRDPARLLAESLKAWGGDRDLWIFGYASLIWRPEFAAAEQRPAVVHGWHRALQMVSNINRGTPQCHGLVFALVSGGSCRGVAYRIERQRAAAELTRLWQREMPTGVYDPKWLSCSTAQGRISGLAFTLSRSSPSFTGRLPDDALIDILRSARGRFGSTLDYLLETSASLARCGIRDREIERLVALARGRGLCGDAVSAAASP